MRWAIRASLLALTLPALGQLALLFFTMLSRFSYPFDLEWMEGGLLTHALRIADGQGIYVAPSIEFVPYPYTPLFPGLLAAIGTLTGITYQTGRAISILSVLVTLAIAFHAIRRHANHEQRPYTWLGFALTSGLFAATYPWVEGWYDIVRGDMLLIVLLVGGITLIPVAAARHTRLHAHVLVGLSAALLTAAYFCKQTGIIYVALGGLLVAQYDWRKLPSYLFTASVLGLGGTWLLNHQSDGWFWTYAFEVLGTHQVDRGRMINAVGHILVQFPAMSLAIVATLLVVTITYWRVRTLPSQAQSFLRWTFAFAISIGVGALGFAKQWAHFNVYIPAMITGAIAAGCTIPTVYACAKNLRLPPLLPPALSLGAATTLSIQLLCAWWSPQPFLPTAEDHKAGQKLITVLKNIQGDIYMPYHPFYPHLAGKKTFAHRMGILDITYSNQWPIAELASSLRNQRFAAVLLDNRPISKEAPNLRQYYQAQSLPKDHQPNLYTGAGASPPKLYPTQLWLPK